ncbi:molybdenum cofactor guanylyltransferase [Bacteroidia bacterium]|nr:molybdenum cofactor guanylyltransferase [Bacteroidia bacterium]
MGLKGVVLMGGQSSRMGQDKSQLAVPTSILSYNSPSTAAQTDEKLQTLAEFAHSKLKCYLDNVHFSINKSQAGLGLENTIVDEYEEEGPLSGIISALKDTQSSILVLGVDMPLVTKQSIKSLIQQRNWDLLTTTFYNNQSNTWEPMLSIWEYETLPCLEEYFNSGGRSIQKFLNQFGNQRVPIPNLEEFTNVNTMEEYKTIGLS